MNRFVGSMVGGKWQLKCMEGEGSWAGNMEGKFGLGGKITT